MTPYMFTFTGRKVNPLDVPMDDICIADIAHHLALINRFCGASRRPISVAQHSVYVARLCKNEGLKVELQALLHDGSEAYLGDVTKWLKQSDEMEAFRQADRLIQLRIWHKFGCPITQHHSITIADKLLVKFELEMECNAVGIFYPDGGTTPHSDYPPTTKEEREAIGMWAPWSWKQSEASFLAAYYSIKQKMSK